MKIPAALSRTQASRSPLAESRKTKYSGLPAYFLITVAGDHVPESLLTAPTKDFPATSQTSVVPAGQHGHLP